MPKSLHTDGYSVVDIAGLGVLAICLVLAIWNYSRAGNPWLTLALYAAPCICIMTIGIFLNGPKLFRNVLNPAISVVQIVVYSVLLLHVHMVPVVARLLVVIVRYWRTHASSGMSRRELILYAGLTSLSYLMFLMMVAATASYGLTNLGQIK